MTPSLYKLILCINNNFNFYNSQAIIARFNEIVPIIGSQIHYMSFVRTIEYDTWEKHVKELINRMMMGDNVRDRTVLYTDNGMLLLAENIAPMICGTS